MEGARAHDDNLRPHLEVTLRAVLSSHHRLHADRPFALEQDLGDPGLGDNPRPRFHRRRQVGEVHRLLGVLGTAEGAPIRAHAAASIARQIAAAPPQRLGTATGDLVVFPHQVRGDRLHTDHLLHALVQRSQRGLRHSFGEPITLRPFLMHETRYAEASA